MLYRIAMIQNGVVVNVSLWDQVSPWNPGDQFTLVDITGLGEIGIGWTYDGVHFAPPVSDA